MSITWIVLGLMGWAVGLLLLFSLMRMASDQDRAARYEENCIRLFEQYRQYDHVIRSRSIAFRLTPRSPTAAAVLVDGAAGRADRRLDPYSDVTITVMRAG